MHILAHSNVVLLVPALFAVLTAANLTALASLIGCFATRRRQTWLAVLAVVAIVLGVGSLVAWLVVAREPIATVSGNAAWIAPCVLGIMSLIRWGSLSA
jgi:hypothetical protein